MDKYEYTVKTDKIRKMAAKGEYKAVAKIADSLDWSKVNDTKLLQTVAKAYEKVGRYSDAKTILLNAYEQVPVGRRMVYKLTELSVKEGNFAEAEDFYREYLEIAPNDTGKYILRYEISAAKGEPITKLISLLEVYRRREFEEKWAYELAELYYKAGRQEDCVKLCDEIIVWFGDGEYVNKAKQLKAFYGIETPEKSRNTGRITEQWNAAALEQEHALQSSMAEIMKKDAATLSSSDFDEDGFAASLGKTKEVVLPIVPEATRDLSDIRKVLDYSTGGDQIPLDLDVIQEAAEEQHQAAMIEHHRWDELLGQGEVGKPEEKNQKTEEFVPEYSTRTELPDDEASLKAAAEREKETVSETKPREKRSAASLDETREWSMEEMEKARGTRKEREADAGETRRIDLKKEEKAADRTDAASARREEARREAAEKKQEETFHASMPEELPAAESKPAPAPASSGSQTLEDLLKEAESLLSGVSSGEGVSLEDALLDAAEKTGENARDAIDAAREERPVTGRPQIVAADSVKNQLNEEKMERRAAREAAAALKDNIVKASERANSREENARAMKEARLADLREKEDAAEKNVSEETDRREVRERPADQYREEEKAAREKEPEVREKAAEESAPSGEEQRQAAKPAASGKKAARCAFLEANDPEKKMDRALESLEKMHARLGTEGGKTARIRAERLNERGIAATMAKLSGRDLIIEDASLLEDSVVEDLAEELKEFPVGGVILLMDSGEKIQELLPRCRALKGNCSYIRDREAAAGKPASEKTAEKPAETGDAAKEEKPAARIRKPGAVRREGASRRTPEKKEAMSMHDFAKCVEAYAKKLECELDDKAGLAIYARAEQLMEDGVELTEEVAREVTDEAVVQAEKPSFRGVFSGKYNKDGFLILREQHFMK